MDNGNIEKSTSVITAVVMASILLGVFLLIVAIVYGAVGTAYDDYAGNVTVTVAVINETGAYVNSTGYSLAGIAAGNTGFTLTALFNDTSGISIALGNATTSAGGIVTNSTAESWLNVSISYTYTDDITDASTVNLGLDGIQTNIFSMVANFFVLMPTIGTILAVVILIAAIVLLVFYVSRMRQQGQGQGSAQFAG